MLTKNPASFPAIRACIFDMDGLLINSEDILTQSTNKLLEKYGRPIFTRSIRTQMMGVPGSTNGDVFHNWAKLPIPREQFAREWSEQMRLHLPDSKPLPGSEKLLSNLSLSCSISPSKDRIELALASGSTGDKYDLKTSRPETKRLLGFFQPERRVLGDDARVPRGRGKPAPDVYLVALQTLNSAVDPGKETILPAECLVFEDSAVGVIAARRAGMRVVWVPHPDVAAEYQAGWKDVVASEAGMNEIGEDRQPGDADEDWVEQISSLENFDYGKYGIVVPN